jgi:ATP-dependent Clp protease ATP-binding subunit ClpA
MQPLNEFFKTTVIEVVKHYNHPLISVDHVCFALIKHDSEIGGIISELGVDLKSILEELDLHISAIEVDGAFDKAKVGPNYLLSYLLSQTIGRAVGSITQSNATLMDLFLNILRLPDDSSFSGHILKENGVILENFMRGLEERISSPIVFSVMENKSKAEKETPKESASTKTNIFPSIAEAEAYLLKFATNLNAEVIKGHIDPLIGRDDEIMQAIKVLTRRRKNNPLFVGDPGVGKTAIAEGLALRIVKKKVPKIFYNKVIYSLEAGSLVAGTRYRGDFEERMKMIIDALTLIPNAIVFIDEIHLIIDGGKVSSGSMDASNLLKPALARGQIKVIGATTYEDFRRSMEKDRALLRRFKKIVISPPTPEQAKLIILGLRSFYETHHEVTYTVEAVTTAVDLVVKYFRDATLPDRALDIIDDAGARIALTRRKDMVITEADIEAEVSMVTKIPLSAIQASEGQSILQLGSNIGKHVFGQDHAIEKVTNVIKIARTGLRQPNKPEAAFLFVGPTGVGKTELARALANNLNVKFVKYDMSEFMERHAVSKLIGSPPGYVGHGDGGAGAGLLINDVEENDKMVLLLDEIEKAHPDVFNILLQIMDDAILTSGSGKKVDFRNVIIIMTSNIGAAALNKTKIGMVRSEPTLDNYDLSYVKKHFSPEFLGRLDGVVPFNKLSIEQLTVVAKKFFKDIETAVSARGISISMDDKVCEWIVTKGHDPLYGARPINRTIDTEVRLPIADIILSNDTMIGWSIKLFVDSDNKLQITPVPPSLKRLPKE